MRDVSFHTKNCPLQFFYIIINYAVVYVAANLIMYHVSTPLSASGPTSRLDERFIDIIHLLI